MDLEAGERQGKEKQNHSVAQQPGKRPAQTLPFFLPYTHASNTGNVGTGAGGQYR